MNHTEQITTIYGTLNLVATDAKHIFLACAWPLTVNGVSIEGSAHMYLWEDDKWYIGNEFDSRGQRNTPWVAKMNSFYFRKVDDYSKKQVSDSQDKKLTEMLLTVTEYWAAANPILLKKAEIGDLRNQFAKKNEEIDGAKALLNKLELEKEAIEIEIVDLNWEMSG